MNITINKPTSIDLKELMHATVPTINKRIHFILGSIVEKEVIGRILTRAREIRILIRNDASATMRLIDLAPAKEAVYRELWAAQANKLLAELGATIAHVARKFGASSDDSNPFLPDEVVVWAIPAPEQKPIEDLELHLKTLPNLPDPVAELPDFTEPEPSEEEETSEVGETVPA